MAHALNETIFLSRNGNWRVVRWTETHFSAQELLDRDSQMWATGHFFERFEDAVDFASEHDQEPTPEPRRKPRARRASSSGFACQECGKKFRTVTAAEKASMNGCPRCGGVDIDLEV